MFTADDLIYEYTRQQAIEDGVLVELDPQLTREAGIRFPVSATQAVFADLIDVHETAKRACQDQTGRTWDVLWMLRSAIQRIDGNQCQFKMYATVNASSSRRRARNPITPTEITLKAVCGPADDGSPCITVMFPDED